MEDNCGMELLDPKTETTASVDCVQGLNATIIACIGGIFLLLLALIYLMALLCWMSCKNRRLKRQLASSGNNGIKKGENSKIEGALENPLYNDLPMTDLEASGQTSSAEQPNYHEISHETAITAMYDAVCSSNLPAQPQGPNYADVTLSDYDVIGEDENFKSNKLPQAVSVERSTNRRRSYDAERALTGVRMSVDIAQLAQNDNVDVFYCNTASPSNPHATQHVGAPQAMTGSAGRQEEVFYINVKH